MKIDLRILCQKDAVAALARDPEVARAVDLSAVTFELGADDPLFGRFLERTRGTSGCWLNPVLEFSRAELAQARLFQLEGRKLVRESLEDYAANLTRLRELPFRATGPFRIRLLDRFVLSRGSLKPNEVAVAGDWSAEFLVSRGAAGIFEQEGLSGFALRPVIAGGGRGGKEYEDLFLLYTESLLPLAEPDLTTPPFPAGEGEGGLRQLGCLTYDFGAGGPPAADFFRTAENWSSNHMPVWVVSARVRDVFTRHKLKGWAFRPVLEKGTALHEAYLAKWRFLMARVSAANPRHHF